MSNIGIPMWVFQEVQPRNSEAKEPTIKTLITKAEEISAAQ